METEKSQEFMKWISLKLKEHNLTENQLAIKAGIGHSVFTRARAGILPKWEKCYAIARALDVSPYELFRLAGLIPAIPEYELEESFEKLRAQFYSLSKERRDTATEIFSVLVRAEEKYRK